MIPKFYRLISIFQTLKRFILLLKKDFSETIETYCFSSNQFDNNKILIQNQNPKRLFNNKPISWPEPILIVAKHHLSMTPDVHTDIRWAAPGRARKGTIYGHRVWSIIGTLPSGMIASQFTLYRENDVFFSLVSRCAVDRS